MLLIIAKILLIIVCIALSFFMLTLAFLSKTISGIIFDLEKKCAELKNDLVFKEKSETLKIVLPWLGILVFTVFDKYLILKSRSGLLYFLDKMIGLSTKIQALIELVKNISKLKDRIKDR